MQLFILLAFVFFVDAHDKFWIPKVIVLKSKGPTYQKTGYFKSKKYLHPGTNYGLGKSGFGFPTRSGYDIIGSPSNQYTVFGNPSVGTPLDVSSSAGVVGTEYDGISGTGFTELSGASGGAEFSTGVELGVSSGSEGVPVIHRPVPEPDPGLGDGLIESSGIDGISSTEHVAYSGDSVQYTGGKSYEPRYGLRSSAESYRKVEPFVDTLIGNAAPAEDIASEGSIGGADVGSTATFYDSQAVGITGSGSSVGGSTLGFEAIDGDEGITGGAGNDIIAGAETHLSATHSSGPNYIPSVTGYQHGFKYKDFSHLNGPPIVYVINRFFRIPPKFYKLSDILKQRKRY